MDGLSLSRAVYSGTLLDVRHASYWSAFSFSFVGLGYSWGVIQARFAAENLAAASTLAFIGYTVVSCVSFGTVLAGGGIGGAVLSISMQALLNRV
jgi:hypothetical protein